MLKQSGIIMVRNSQTNQTERSGFLFWRGKDGEIRTC